MLELSLSVNRSMKIYLVGGAVRDKLLNYPVKERDWVVVGGTPEMLLTKNYKTVGKDFPVFLHPDTGEEYALARTERKSGRGYGGFTFHTAPDVTLEQDLERRDLTINAIAEDEDGTLVDPYGGVADLKARVLRHVSPAFEEDPLRVLRVARFAARYHHLGFNIADETLALMTKLSSSGELDYLTKERVWKEISRALEGEHPEVFFRVLYDCGALEVLLPEVHALFGVPQPPQHHPEVDTGVHCLLALEQICRLSPSLDARFATLTHDLGKGTTPADILPSHHGHETRGLKLINQLCNRLAVPNSCRELALLVSEYHTHCHRAFELKATTLLNLLERLDVFRRPERFELFLLVCEADARGRTGLEDRAYPQVDFLRAAQHAVISVEIKPLLEQGLTGAELGQALRNLRLQKLKALKNAEEFKRGRAE